MIDVLALPLEKALTRYKNVEQVQVVRSEPHFRRCGITTGPGMEYVVRQHWLDNHKVVLTTVIKYRKEVLENGIED
jgi:hypothetical protein